jgi:hypothetical protein
MLKGRERLMDWMLGGTLSLVGAASVVVALLQRFRPMEMNPGVEGSLTVVALAPIVALAHGLSYRATLKLMAPILLIQAFTLAYVAAPVFAVLGLELFITGALGVLCSLRAPAGVAEPAAAVRGPAAGAPVRAARASHELAHF